MLAETFYTIHLLKYWQVADRPKDKYLRSQEEDIFSKKNLLFHISNDDYFGTLATVLGLLKETILEKNIGESKKEWQRKALNKTSSELMFLQENYKIIPKKNENREV